MAIPPLNAHAQGVFLSCLWTFYIFYYFVTYFDISFLILWMYRLTMDGIHPLDEKEKQRQKLTVIKTNGHILKVLAWKENSHYL